MRVAAIDVGTNTTRLLVAEGTGPGYRDLDRRLVFTRLGSGVDAKGQIAKEAQDRTLATIAEFCAECGEFAVQKMRIAGTSAVRDATNREEFLKAASKLAGVEAEVLAGEEEARLSFVGATADLDFGTYLVIDIGGGSTEFVLGRSNTGVEHAVSMDIGSVRLTERHLLSDPPATEEVLTMEGDIEQALDKVDRHHIPNASVARFVGAGGTVTTLAAIHVGAEEYDPQVTHQMTLSRSSVNSLYHDLAKMPVEHRMRMPALPSGRADVIVAGASILARAMARWSFAEVIVSEKDILDGLVLQMLGDPEL
ncbi:MAG: exopolyphosphatase [Actinomycetota bacterium]|nr:Ppx/GppA family phosphatase [Actinomycetota bacterium]